MQKDFNSLNRQMGEVSVKIDAMMEKLEDHKELHKEIKDILKNQGDRITTLEHYKTRVAVFATIVAAVLSWVGSVLAKAFQ